MVKNTPANAGEVRDAGLTPGLGRCPGEGHGNWCSPVFVPGDSHGRRSLAGYSPWAHKEPDATDRTACTHGDSLVQIFPASAEDVGSVVGQEGPLEKEMTTRSSTRAWTISWTEEPGVLRSMGSQKCCQ